MVVNAATFDTLEAARELEAAGMDRRMAEATAESIRKASTANFEQLATKADLALLQTALDGKIDGKIATLNHKIDSNFVTLEGKIEALRAEVTAIKWIVGLQFLLLLCIIARLFAFI